VFFKNKPEETCMSIKQQYFNYLRQTAEIVDPYVTEFLKNRFPSTSKIGPQLHSRYRFGKSQLRPAIVRLSFELVGGQDTQRVIPACAAVEVKETAYYCLDDIIDKGAEYQLLLPGVGFHAISYDMICDISHFVPAECLTRVLREMASLDANILEGAFLDLEMHDTDEQYYMRKVGAYNFWEHALRIGAIIGGGVNGQIELLGKIGKTIGMAYIIANDCLDFGKNLEDFRQQKSTLPIIFAFKNTSGYEHDELEALFGKDVLSDDEIYTVRTIIVQSGAIEHGKEKAKSLCDQAIVWLKQHFPASKARDLLEFSTTWTQKNKYFDLLNEYL
jgi:geranylgeranyl pyrophosphate synthase